MGAAARRAEHVALQLPGGAVDAAPFDGQGQHVFRGSARGGHLDDAEGESRVALGDRNDGPEPGLEMLRQHEIRDLPHLKR